MNYRNIWELIKINILYSSPQTLTALQKKRAKNPGKTFSSYKAVLRQQLLLVFVFLIIYLIMFLTVDYSKSSGYFSFQVALFSIVAIISGFTTLFSVFYDSNDTKLYLPLPVKEKEVYLAKLISSQGGSLPFLVPLLSLFTIAYWQMTHSIVLVILATLINFLLLLLMNNAISIILIYLIGQLLVKSSHKKLISTILMVLSTVLAISLIFYMQYNNSNYMDNKGQIDTVSIPYFKGFYDVIRNPFSMASLLNFWLGIIIMILLWLFIWRAVISTYFKQFLSIEASQPTRRKVKKAMGNTSLVKILRRHHLSTLKDATLLIQTYLFPLILIISLISPILSSGESYFQSVADSFFGVAFVIGIMVGSFIVTPTSFLGVGISLEKENYTFIKSLPLSLTSFLKQKFYLLFLVQLGLPIFIYLLISIFILKLSLPLLLAFLVGIIASSFVIGELMYWRDYHLLNLKWQNVTQLFSRGAGQWFILALILGNLMVGGLLLTAMIILSASTSILGVGIAVFVLILSLLGGLHYFVYKHFWQKLT